MNPRDCLACTHRLRSGSARPLRRVAEDLSDAAMGLNRAAAIEDPYMRADAIWEAVQCLTACTGPLASSAERIARRLEHGCDRSRLPPAGRELQRQARLLEGQVKTLIGISLSAGMRRAAHQPAWAGHHHAIGI
jgi:hypothetical protein